MSEVKVTNHIGEFITDVQKRWARSMTQVLILGSSEASVMTPVDTSNLLNSQFRSVDINADKIVGTVSYSANYARWVHDPAVKQTFRRATAEKEFLTKGFSRAKPNIDAVMSGALKV